MMLGALARSVGVWASLTLWLCCGLGLRFYYGGLDYLERLFGPELAPQAADRLFSRQAELNLEMIGQASDLRGLMFGLVASLAGVFVLLILWPVEGIFRLIERLRRRETPIVWARLGVSVAMGVATAAAILLSVHPLLNLPQVPEGPRMLLNFACEAAGYGWVNGLVYAGVIGAAAGFAAMQARARGRAMELRAAAVDGAVDGSVDGAADDERAE